MQADPSDLIPRAQQGDQAAFEALYRAHVGRVYALCLRLTADRARAEELTQDAFVRAWERLASFRGESAFSSWLCRLTVNGVFLGGRTGRRRAVRAFTTAGPAALEAVAELRGLVDGARGLPRPIEPGCDLWTGIARRIGQRETGKGKRWWRGALAAAATLVIGFALYRLLPPSTVLSRPEGRGSVAVQ